MRILVTGAAGFLGHHVAEHLLARGDEIVGLDNFDESGGRERKEVNASDLKRWPGWWLVRGDVRDRSLLRRLCSGDSVEAVVHLAARCSLEEGRREPERHSDVNVTGTATVLEAALRGGVRHVVVASSASVHGAAAAPQAADAPAEAPLSVHAATKRSAELLCAAWAARERMVTTALRLHSIYGPRQRPDGAVHAFLEALEAGRRIPRHGDGSRVRDHLHVEDAAKAFVAALDQSSARSPGHRNHEIGTGRGTSLSELIAALGEAVGREPEIEELRSPRGCSPSLVADAEATRRELGWSARIELKDGLREQLEWQRSVRKAPAIEPVAEDGPREEAR